jgi:hypothetical protein
LEETTAVAFNPALVVRSKPADEWLVFSFRHGSRVAARAWSAVDGAIQLTTVDGLKLTSKIADVAGIQSFGRHVTYLSDLEAKSYRHRPFLDLGWQFQNDRNTLGGRLHCGGRVFEKGLGMHSIAGLTYDLDRSYQKFEADLGIDDATEAKGSVVFRVYVDDGSGEWTPKFQSTVVRGGDPPVPISVDLAGVRRITLIVDLADHGDEMDHAVWLDARLIP